MSHLREAFLSSTLTDVPDKRPGSCPGKPVLTISYPEVKMSGLQSSVSYEPLEDDEAATAEFGSHRR